MTNEELLKVIEDAKASGVTELDLSGKGLTTLPNELFQLRNLVTLDLSGNLFATLPQEICQLRNLATLDLSGNLFAILPQEICQLRNLTRLALSSNQLAILPPEICQFRNLTTLNLSGNLFTTLPQEICQLRNLTRLALSSNQLAILPPEIGQLVSLTRLYIDHNQLTSLPPKIGQLTSLKKLNLDNNRLTALPQELFQLANLTNLNLENNQLRYLPPEICQLKNLSELHLSCNQLRALPPELFQLTKLATLDFRNNQLISLPPEICLLTKLTFFDLRNNQLISLPPEICQLKNLSELYLSDNQLASLPQEICILIQLKCFVILNNPLISPPPEIAMQGIEAMHQYFTSLQEADQPLNEVKLLLVGDGAVGKTSLVKQLLGQPFDQHEDTTHGINIQGWEQEVGGRKIRINIWDFGGQEIMHATHQFFLSKRSLYVLVLDGRKDERAEYWLRHIESFGGNSPVLVVLNKQDANPGFDINRPFLREKYPGTHAFFRISCKTGIGIAQFKEALLHELSSMSMLGIRWPASWFAVKGRLMQMDRPYISCDEYESLCAEAGITAQGSREVLVDFLNDLGVAIHFKDFLLSAMHVLDPIWVTNAIYRIINAEELTDSQGILYLDSLPNILRQGKYEKYSYPEQTHTYIMGLMKKFELCYPFGKDAVLIPQLLPVPEPKFSFDYSGALGFVLHYPNFLPPSVLPRFMVKAHKDINDDLGWRTGAVLRDEESGTAAVVKTDHEARRINIWVNGEHRREYLHYLRYLFAYINSRFEKLVVRERVPMPDEPYITADYETLLKYAARMIDVYFPAGSSREYSVRKLLDSVQPKNADELSIIAQKMELKPDEKESFMKTVKSCFNTKLAPTSVEMNLAELFKQIQAWDKQRQQQSRR